MIGATFFDRTESWLRWVATASSNMRLAVPPARKVRRWPARLPVVAALVAAVLLAAASAQADPTPLPPAPTQAPDTASCGGGDLPDGQQRWCFPWADYTATPPERSVSHWTTACSRTKSPDERAACQTVSFELAADPKDGAQATLADVPVGTARTKDMVGCRQFTLAAAAAAGRGPEGYQESQLWAAKAGRCDAIAAALLPALGATVSPAPPKVEQECEVFDQQCKIDKAVDGAVEHGMDAGIQGVVSLLVQGAAKLLSFLASQVFTQTSIGAPDDAFYLVYNSTAGIMLIFVFVLFVVSAIINTLRFNSGPGPLASVGGLIRAVLGIVTAGGIAWLIVTAWDEATNALLQQNADTNWDASVWITALTNLSNGTGTGALAGAAGLLSIIGLFFLLVIMLFRGMLTTGAALFGAIAMAGQASHETRSWGRRWFWTVNALAGSKFAIAALWIYGTRAAYESDDITTVLQAVLVIWLMVFAPGILLRLTAIWDGYLADVNGRGFVTAAGHGNGVGDLTGAAADWLTHWRGGGNGDAADVMADNVSDIDNAPDDPSGNDLGEGAVELADGANTNVSGERVGAPDGDGGPADRAGGEGSANAEEAEAIGDIAAGVRTDVGTGTADQDETGPSTPEGAPVGPAAGSDDMAALPGPVDGPGSNPAELTGGQLGAQADGPVAGSVDSAVSGAAGGADTLGGTAVAPTAGGTAAGGGGAPAGGGAAGSSAAAAAAAV